MKKLLISILVLALLIVVGRSALNAAHDRGFKECLKEGSKINLEKNHKAVFKEGETKGYKIALCRLEVAKFYFNKRNLVMSYGYGKVIMDGRDGSFFKISTEDKEKAIKLADETCGKIPTGIRAI